jgi:hypothetical protein
MNRQADNRKELKLEGHELLVTVYESCLLSSYIWFYNPHR